MGFQDGSAWGVDEYGRHAMGNDENIKRLRDHEWRTFQRAKQSWDSMYGELSPEERREALFGSAD